MGISPLPPNCWPHSHCSPAAEAGACEKHTVAQATVSPCATAWIWSICLSNTQRCQDPGHRYPENADNLQNIWLCVFLGTWHVTEASDSRVRKNKAWTWVHLMSMVMQGHSGPQGKWPPRHPPQVTVSILITMWYQTPAAEATTCPSPPFCWPWMLLTASLFLGRRGSQHEDFQKEGSLTFLAVHSTRATVRS